MSVLCPVTQYPQTDALNMKPAEIQKQREALGLSREALAGRAGLSLRTVERIERGETEPRRATLTVLRMALTEDEGAAA